MAFPIGSDMVSHGIQLSVAPVFLLTAVAGMIGAVAQRLARIVDRARLVEAGLRLDQSEQDAMLAHAELKELRTRGLLVNGSIALLTLCAVLIGLTIVVLFLGETIDFQMQRISIFSFLAGVVFFILALLSFMTETLIATRMLNFGRMSRQIGQSAK